MQIHNQTKINNRRGPSSKHESTAIAESTAIIVTAAPLILYPSLAFLPWPALMPPSEGRQEHVTFNILHLLPINLATQPWRWTPEMPPKQDPRLDRAAKLLASASEDIKLKVPEAMRAKGYSTKDSKNRTLQQKVRQRASKLKAAYLPSSASSNNNVPRVCGV